MSLLQPLALAALLVVPLIYLIYVLHGSRRRARVPALFLWANLPTTQTARTRRRRPPLSLLLLLQVLVAGLVALALARPATSTAPVRHVAVIVDDSLSMQATDVAPSRFDAARAQARARLAGLGLGDTASLILADVSARLVASGSPTQVASALSGLQPGIGRPAIGDALSLAASQLSGTPDQQGSIVLVTDGAWPAPTVGTVRWPVEVVPVGGGDNNQAVTALQVRLDPAGGGQTAFVEVANFGAQSVSVPLRLSADGAPIEQRTLDLSPRGRTGLSVPLPLDAHRVTAQLLGHDALAVDDTATVLAPGGPARSVLVLGQASPALQRALGAIPYVHLLQGTSPSASADLTVLAGTLPAQLPPGPLLLVDPPADSARLLGVGIGSGARVQVGHPLLQGLDLTGLEGQTPSVSGVPGWARVVLGTQQGPLILSGSLEGHPTVALDFDPALGGLDKSLVFPLLVSNATSYLLAQADPSAVASPAFDPAQSDIAPRPLPAFARSAEPTAPGLPTERWAWLAGAALALLGIEWWVFARRG